MVERLPVSVRYGQESGECHSRIRRRIVAKPSRFWMRAALFAMSQPAWGSPSHACTAGGVSNASIKASSAASVMLIEASWRPRSSGSGIWRRLSRSCAKQLLWWKRWCPEIERFRLVAELAEEGVPVRKACYALGVSPSGFYDGLARPPWVRSIRHAWLSDVIAAVHAETKGTYGRERMHAELVHGHGLQIGHKHWGTAAWVGDI